MAVTFQLGAYRKVVKGRPMVTDGWSPMTSRDSMTS